MTFPERSRLRQWSLANLNVDVMYVRLTGAANSNDGGNGLRGLLSLQKVFHRTGLESRTHTQ